MNLPTDRRRKLRPTELRAMISNVCHTMRANLTNRRKICGRQATLLPKPSHILLIQAVAMRLFLALIAIVTSGSAQAQLAYLLARYTPCDLPYVGEYALSQA